MEVWKQNPALLRCELKETDTGRPHTQNLCFGSLGLNCSMLAMPLNCHWNKTKPRWVCPSMVCVVQVLDLCSKNFKTQVLVKVRVSLLKLRSMRQKESPW